MKDANYWSGSDDYWSDSDCRNVSDFPKWLEEYMAKEIKYKNSDKRFLSAHPDQNGNVVWGCMMSEYADGEFSLECDLQIGDCSKWVNLEFGVYRYDNQGKPILPSINKRLRKLDKLINSLLKLRSSLEECKKIIKEGR